MTYLEYLEEFLDEIKAGIFNKRRKRQVTSDSCPNVTHQSTTNNLAMGDRHGKLPWPIHVVDWEETFMI